MSTWRGVVTLSALASALLLACGLTAHAEEPSTPVYADVPPAPPAAQCLAAYNKGLAYLLNTQNRDGSWGSFESERVDYEVMLGTMASHDAFRDATTGLCIMALLDPSRENPSAFKAVEKGVRYLFKRHPVRRAMGEVLYSVWTQVYALDAAAAVLKDARLSKYHDQVRQCAREHIAVLGTIQGSEGGFGYYDFQFAAAHPKGDHSASFTTAAALIALKNVEAAGVSVPASLAQDAQTSLARLRLPTGAYVYGTSSQVVPQRLYNDVKGSLGRSQVCNLALRRYGAGITDDDLRAGLDNLFKHHHFIEMGKSRPYPHESWYYTAGYYFFFGHYYGAQVARELPGVQSRHYLDGLQSVMCRLQDTDGSWWDFPLYGYHKPYGTAFALMTLALAREEHSAPPQ